MPRGFFLTLEGGDGVGKSTQAKRLADKVRAAGRAVTLTREPGGAPGAEEIRALLVRGDPGRWSAETELLLFNAARRDHVERTIAPALERGEVVICDRFVDSTRVYQGVVRGAEPERVDRLHELMIGLDPDLTLVLDLPAEAGLARGLGRGGEEARFEAMGGDFQAALREGFRSLAASARRFRLIDASGAEEVVAERVWAAAAPALGLPA